MNKLKLNCIGEASGAWEVEFGINPIASGRSLLPIDAQRHAGREFSTLRRAVAFLKGIDTPPEVKSKVEDWIVRIFEEWKVEMSMPIVSLITLLDMKEMQEDTETLGIKIKLLKCWSKGRQEYLDQDARGVLKRGAKRYDEQLWVEGLYVVGRHNGGFDAIKEFLKRDLSLYSHTLGRRQLEVQILERIVKGGDDALDVQRLQMLLPKMECWYKKDEKMLAQIPFEFTPMLMRERQEVFEEFVHFFESKGVLLKNLKVFKGQRTQGLLSYCQLHRLEKLSGWITSRVEAESIGRLVKRAASQMESSTHNDQAIKATVSESNAAGQVKPKGRI